MRTLLRISAILCVAAATILIGVTPSQACGGASKYGATGKGAGYGGYAKMSGARAGKPGYAYGGFGKSMSGGAGKYASGGKSAK